MEGREWKMTTFTDNSYDLYPLLIPQANSEDR